MENDVIGKALPGEDYSETISEENGEEEEEKEEEKENVFKFASPASIAVVGPTMSGE